MLKTPARRERGLSPPPALRGSPRAAAAAPPGGEAGSAPSRRGAPHGPPGAPRRL